MMKQFASVIGCAGALVLGGCQSAATRVYTLPPTAPAARSSTVQIRALRVDSLSVPAGWDRIEILQPSSTGRLQISDFDHWSAPLGQVARQALSADLSERLPPGSVIYPHLPKPSGALGINVDILEFSVSATRASIQASWVITATGVTTPGVTTPGVTTPGTKRSEAVLQASISSTVPAGVVHAWSELLGQLADHIAADLASFQ